MTAGQADPIGSSKAPPALSQARTGAQRHKPLPKYHPAVLSAAAWAVVAARYARRQLRRHGASASVPKPFRATPAGTRGVQAALRRYAPTCLERALVEQAWLAALGTERSIVIGVPPEGLKSAKAHAWVDGTGGPEAEAYLELYRIPPNAPRRRARARWHRK
jgi:hypothetical protein